MRCELIRVGKRKTLQSFSLVFFVASKGTLRNVLHHRPGYSIQFSQTPKGQPNPTSKCKCLAIFSPAYHTTKLLLSATHIIPKIQIFPKKKHLCCIFESKSGFLLGTKINYTIVKMNHENEHNTLIEKSNICPKIQF